MALDDAAMDLPELSDTYAIGILQQGGWIMEHPNWEMAWFMNMKSGNMIEVLGEL